MGGAFAILKRTTQTASSAFVSLPDGGDNDSVGAGIAGGVVGSGFEDISCSSSCGSAPGAPKGGGGVGALQDIVPAEFYFGHLDIIGDGSAHRNSRIPVLEAVGCREADRHTRRNLILSRE